MEVVLKVLVEKFGLDNDLFNFGFVMFDFFVCVIVVNDYYDFNVKCFFIFEFSWDCKFMFVFF